MEAKEQLTLFCGKDGFSGEVRKVREIPSNQIEIPDEYSRSELDLDHVRTLESSIRSDGLLQPILVREKVDGYMLCGGMHRLMACRNLEWDWIPAFVLGKWHSNAGYMESVIENVTRKEMTKQEEIVAVGYLYNEKGFSPSQIMELTGHSRGWVDLRIEAIHFPQNVLNYVLDGSIGLQTARELARIEDEPIRKLITSQAGAGRWSASHVRAQIEAYQAVDENFPTGEQQRFEMDEKTDPEKAEESVVGESAAPGSVGNLPGIPCPFCHRVIPVEEIDDAIEALTSPEQKGC